MLGHFPVCPIDLGGEPILRVVHACLKVVRHKHNCRSTEVPEHIYMGMDPVFHVHFQTIFCVGIHAERQHTDEQICCAGFSGVSIHDVEFFSGSVYLDTISGFSGDVHRCTIFLGVLLEVKAELRVHEWLPVGLSAFLAVLHPE